MNKKLTVISIVIVFVVCTSQGLAQGVTASIVGSVTDSSGAVLPGVTVTATNEGTGLKRDAVTNESGNYTIPLLPVGVYTVETQMSGFRSEGRKGITLNVDARLRLDFTLRVGQITENVFVTGEAPLVQTEDSAVGFVVDNKKIVELPLNGRKFEQLVQLVPGAVQAAEGSLNANRGLFSIAGQPEVSSNFLLDGVDNIDPVVRIYAYRPSIDLIEEFKVQTSTYSAEFGRNSGAVVNVTTKSGTNELHGSAWEFHRNARLNAKNFFDSPTAEDPAPREKPVRCGIRRPDQT
jgi:Carboxypeptidase regulatory-like domain